MDWSIVQDKVDALKRLVPETKKAIESKFNPMPVGTKTVVKDGNLLGTLSNYFNGVKDFYSGSNEERSDKVSQFVDRFFPAKENSSIVGIGTPGSNTATNALMKFLGNSVFANQLENPTKFDINTPEGRQKIQDQSLAVAMNVGTPLEAKRLAKGLPPQVLSSMEDFTNYVAQVKNKVIKPDYQYEGEMRKILEDFGMNTNKSNTKLVSDFADVLSEADALAMKPKYTKDVLGRFTGSKSTQPTKGGGGEIGFYDTLGKYKSGKVAEQEFSSTVRDTLKKHGMDLEDVKIVGSYAEGKPRLKPTYRVRDDGSSVDLGVSDVDVIVKPTDITAKRFYREFPKKWTDAEIQFNRKVRLEIEDELKKRFPNTNFDVDLGIPNTEGFGGKRAVASIEDIYNSRVANLSPTQPRRK